MPFLPLVTLTLDLDFQTYPIARVLTRLPSEFGANPFSGSGISYTNKKPQKLPQFTACGKLRACNNKFVNDQLTDKSVRIATR